MKTLLLGACLALAISTHAFGEAPTNTPPAKAFDLSEWKLQIPGPKEFKDLKNYASDYFYLNADREMCFRLDASEQGHTKNTKYVRSELRHNLNWKATEKHSLTGEFRVESQLTPDKVTLLQIHGITDAGDNAPPLLRIAVNKGNLYAMLKTSATGESTESNLLRRGVGSSWVKVGINVAANQLSITVDGEEKLHWDISYWKFSNYFKAGLYPQALEGKVQGYFRELKAE